MISFIVIGCNEERNLKKCFDAIYQAIHSNSINEYEIIYVDSKSIDSSIQIAQRLKEIKVFSITGYCNAAIGRNIGARESKGNILFFIDGDMEIEKDFLSLVLDDQMNLKYDFVAGQVLDIVEGFQSKYHYNIQQTSQIINTHDALGGIFLVKREKWELINGMRTKFNTGEESDFAYRLINNGFFFTYRREIIAKHYTNQDYQIDRMWKMLLNKGCFYSRCVFYRDHFKNKNTYYAMWKLDKTFIMMVVFIFLIFFFPRFTLLFWGIYFLAIAFRCFKLSKGFKAFKYIPYFFAFDFLNIVFLFSFFPKNKELEYVEL